jgi:hypothetical protein
MLYSSSTTSKSCESIDRRKRLGRRMIDLKSERARLEAEVADLQREVRDASAKLDVARQMGPRPRGFGVGLAFGAALVLGAVGAAFYSFFRFMSHYG